MSQAVKFSALHVRGTPFVLPNAWDAASARIYEQAGFAAIATSSAAMAWSLGYADGEAVDLDALFAAIAGVVRAVKVPVSADLEAGFGTGVASVVTSFERALAAGVVGANFEDYDNAAHDVVPIAIQVERLRAIRARADALGTPFFINGRTDVLLHALGEPKTRVDRCIERLQAYAAAGADGVFAPGTSDLETIARIASAVDAPLNVLANPTMPPRTQLAQAGVARISIGSAPMRRTLYVLRDLARSLRVEDGFSYTRDPAIPFDELNDLFA